MSNLRFWDTWQVFPTSGCRA